MEKTVIKGKVRVNSIFAYVLAAAAILSCGRSSEYFEFHESGAPHNASSGYVFEVPFNDPGAIYDSFLAFRFADTSPQGCAVPVTVKVSSPTFRFGLEKVSFRVGRLRPTAPEVEFPYRSGICVAQDTGLWHISVYPDTTVCSSITGVGFRYKKRDR